MKSVLTEEEYSRTKLIVEDFGKPGGKGEMLQEKLKKVAESKDNWVNIILALIMLCRLDKTRCNFPNISLYVHAHHRVVTTFLTN